MRATLLTAAAVVVAVVIPVQANAARVTGIVVAKFPQRGALVLAGAHGNGTTVRLAPARVRRGDRIEVRGQRIHDGTMLGSALTIRSHTTHALVRGVVVRQRGRTTFLSTGRSVIVVHAGAARAGLRAGRVVTFRVRIDDDGALVAQSATQGSTTTGVVVEGRIVSVSPFVVSVEGLPITITVPAGMTLPAGLAPGVEIEFTVQVGAGNVFTLVSIDEIENDQPQAGQEVEVKGSVVASTASQLMVLSHGITFTFDAPAGATLPIFPVGTFVEAKGVANASGHLTLLRVKVEDDEDAGGGDDGGGGGHGH
jgi:hypothetical protein